MLGAIVGDIVGSVYEFNNHRSKDFPLFRDDSHFTDDTILTIATAEALMHYEWDFAGKYREYGRKYASSYGNSFLRWIHDDEAGPYNSFGNGSAMRVSPVAWFERHEHRVMFIAERSAEVTHNHPEGIKGAQATAMVILWARSGVPLATTNIPSSDAYFLRTRFTPRSVTRPGPTADLRHAQVRYWQARRAVQRAQSSTQRRAARNGSRTGTPPALGRRNQTLSS